MYIRGHLQYTLGLDYLFVVFGLIVKIHNVIVM